MRQTALGAVMGLAIVVGAFVGPRDAASQSPILVGYWPSTGVPLGLALDANGRLYMPDEHSANLALRVFSQTGTPFGVFDSGTGFEGYGVAVLSDQTILVADYYGRRVRRYAPDGSFLSEWPTGGGRALFLALDESDNVFVTDDEGDAVRKFSSQGTLLAQWTVTHPSGVAYVNGLVYVSEMFNGHVNIYATDGTLQGSFATGCTFAEQLFFDGLGNLYLADHGLHQLKCFSTSGDLLWTMGPSVSGYPYAITDFFSVLVAPDGTLFAGDYANRNVLVFSHPPTPTKSRSFGSLKSRYRGVRVAAQPVQER